MNLQKFRDSLNDLRDGQTTVDEILKEFPIADIQAIFMDRTMPELTGFQKDVLNHLVKSDEISVFLWSMLGQLGMTDTPYQNLEYKGFKVSEVWFSDTKMDSVEDEVFSQEYNIQEWLKRISQDKAYESSDIGLITCVRDLHTMPLFWGMNTALFGKRNLFSKLSDNSQENLLKWNSQAQMMFNASDENGVFRKTPITINYGFSDISIGDFQGLSFSPEALSDLSRAIMLSRDKEEAQQMLMSYLVFRYFVRHGRGFAEKYFGNWGLYNQLSENNSMQLNVDHTILSRFIQEVKQLLS